MTETVGDGVVATAPVRVADIGGWTDTWYARSGRVCNIAVAPGARVVLRPVSGDGSGLTVTLRAGTDSYSFRPGAGPGRHPLLEAVVAACPPPQPVALDVGAHVPPGSGLGTSAAVVVALLAALRAARHDAIDPATIAAQAHAIESGLGWETGVQDQWAAAFGGIGDLVVRYPDVVRRDVRVSAATLDQLDARLVTYYLGRPHSSSETHKVVISHLGDVGAESPYGTMRRAAAAAVDALEAGDLDAYAATMTVTTEAMRAIETTLISAGFDRLIAIAREYGSPGWKVNGAGGDGGSISIVGPANEGDRATMRAELASALAASAAPGHEIEHAVARAGVRVTRC